MFTKGDKVKIIGNHAILSQYTGNYVGYKGTIVGPDAGYEDDSEYGDYDHRPYWVKIEYDGCNIEVKVIQKDMKLI